MIKVKFIGGLGNQMFQYAFKKKLEKLYEGGVAYDLSGFEMSKGHNGFEIFNVFYLNNEKEPKWEKSKLEKFYKRLKNSFIKGIKKYLVVKKYKEIIVFEDKKSLFSFNEIDYNLKNVLYQGYWQSEYFFEDIKGEILESFIFKNPLDIKNLEILNKIRNTNSVSLHVRRGDYLQSQNIYIIQDENYYKKSIEKIKENIKNPVFFIFSDDIKWCKEHLLNILGENYYFIDNNRGKDSYKDMQLMSECKHNIIANSSFSWWGAWLNKNKDKIVIAPKNYYTKECGISSEHIIPKNWINI